MVDSTDESFDKTTRRTHGIHYTNKENILKVIKPLFLDDLYKELNNIESNDIVLYQRFHNKLTSLTFFDPSCGSGNFLSITYREIRILEHLVLYKIKQIDSNCTVQTKVNIDQLYGIELNNNSVNIAKTNLLNIHDSMNQELSKMFDLSSNQLPTKKQSNIICGDALEINWNDVLPVLHCNYILGNPPFVGSSLTSKKQKSQVFNITKSKKLDYVTAWFVKASQYCNDHTRIGLVSTNSICQGEQVYPLWTILLDRLNMNIIFAYKSFNWTAETKYDATVSVIIIGLSKDNNTVRYLYDNDIVKECNYITPYLNSSKKKRPIVCSISDPLNNLPNMTIGTRPLDGGNYIFTVQEKDEFLRKEPTAEKYMKPYLSGKDFLNNGIRYILLLRDIKTSKLQKMPHIMDRVEKVKKMRLASKNNNTRKFANTPLSYRKTLIPSKPYLVIPEVSSEKRKYIPIGFIEPPVIPSNQLMLVQNANISLFGLLISKMHMTWLRVVGGRLGNALRYSSVIVYNTFPVPKDDLTVLEPLAQKIFDIRSKYKDSSLADLYDPDTMPADLLKAHQQLDKKVESLYRTVPFQDDDDRLEFLLEEYEKLVGKQDKL